VRALASVLPARASLHVVVSNVQVTVFARFVVWGSRRKNSPLLREFSPSTGENTKTDRENTPSTCENTKSTQNILLSTCEDRNILLVAVWPLTHFLSCVRNSITALLNLSGFSTGS
jgi:hypothetical protein